MVDRYTKAMLTIIAAALIVIAVKDSPLVTNAEAQMPYSGQTVNVRIQDVASTAFTYTTVPVRVRP